MMRILKMLCIAAAVAASTIGAATTEAAAESAAVTNYKQAVTKRVEVWGARMSKLNDDLSKLKTELEMLSGQNSGIPTNDPQAMAKDVRDKITGVQETMRFETNTLMNDVGLMTVSPPDKNETIPLPGFVKDLIKSKGLPFAKNVSFVPNISWNFKSGTLGSAGGTITITFQKP
jgi:hypothetical protein